MREKVPKPRLGRPPKGSLARDGVEKVRNYPKLALTVRPSTRILLNAASAVEQRAAWQIVDDAINGYVDRMPAEARRLVDGIAKLTENKSA